MHLAGPTLALADFVDLRVGGDVLWAWSCGEVVLRATM